MSVEGTPGGNGSGDSERLGAETEKKMADVLSSFEDVNKNRLGHSDFLMVSYILNGYLNEGGTIGEFAKDPNFFVKDIIAKQCPNIETRELLAAAVEKKYLDQNSPFQENLSSQEIADENRQDIGRGRMPGKLRTSRDIDMGARNIVSFLTLYNDRAVEEEEDKPTESELQKMENFRGELEKRRKIEKAETLRRFFEEEVELPGSNDQKITLREWAERISKYRFKDDLPSDAKKHYDNASLLFQGVFSQRYSYYDQGIIAGDLQDQEMELYKKWMEAASVLKSHEPTKDNQGDIQSEESLREARKNTGLLLRFIRFVMYQSEVPRL